MTEINPLNQNRQAGLPASAPLSDLSQGRMPATVELDHSRCLVDDLRIALDSGTVVTLVSNGEFLCRIERHADGRCGVIRAGESTERMYVPGQQILVERGESVILVCLPVPNISLPVDENPLILGSGGVVPCPTWVQRVVPEVVSIRREEGLFLAERKQQGSVAIELLGPEKLIDYGHLELHPRRVCPGGGLRLGGNWYLQFTPPEVGFTRPKGDQILTCAKSDGMITLPSFVPSRVKLEIRNGPDDSIYVQDHTAGFLSVMLRHLNGKLLWMKEPYKFSAEQIRGGVEVIVDAPTVPLARMVLKAL